MTTSLEQAAVAFGRGDIVVITGDRFRSGDIDLAISARHAGPEAINFLATHGRGLICLAMTRDRAVRLGIGLLNAGEERNSGRPLGCSIEARTGVSTGISVADRARTVAVASADGASADDICSPGHVFPLLAAPGGVRERAGAAEAAIELCRLSGSGDTAVICSIMREDGEMARLSDIDEFLTRNKIITVDIEDMIETLAPRIDRARQENALSERPNG